MAGVTDTHDTGDVRPQFGNRHLTDAARVFEHNAWDDVEWSEELESDARAKISANSAEFLEQEKCEQYELEADKYWDEFYSLHQNKFFKDRHWLFTEFPELEQNSRGKEENDESVASKVTGKVLNENQTNLSDNITIPQYPGDCSSFHIFEAGCGVGNTIFPILQTSNDSNLFVYGCDFATSAIDIVRAHSLYDTKRCHAFVCDISEASAKFPFPEASVDCVVLIFVLSALQPEVMTATVARLARLLRPGGVLLFRDYGRYDMAQLRFKKGRCLAENFYVRGDGTRVYFFTQDELDEMFTAGGLEKEQNILDRRLQVNRGRQLKMYRVWVQCKYRKPSSIQVN